MNSFLTPSPEPLIQLILSDDEWLNHVDTQDFPEVPLFRYFAPHGFVSIEEERLAFCSPSCFNDPFELMPHVKLDNTREAKRMVENCMKTLTIKDSFLQLPRKERRRKLREVKME